CRHVEMRRVIRPEQRAIDRAAAFCQAGREDGCGGVQRAVEVATHLVADPAAEGARVGEQREREDEIAEAASHARILSSLRPRAALTWLAMRSASARATAMPRSVKR